MGLPMGTPQRFVSDFVSGLFIYIVPFIAAQIFTWILLLIGHLGFDGKTFYIHSSDDPIEVTSSWTCNNGHIGFNEPAPEFPKETHCVALTESTINANSRLFDSADDVPREAYTMGIGTIMAAKEILVVANGADKADIVRRAFFGPVTPEVPASILQFHPNVTVVVDKEAAALCQ